MTTTDPAAAVARRKCRDAQHSAMWRDGWACCVVCGKDIRPYPPNVLVRRGMPSPPAPCSADDSIGSRFKALEPDWPHECCWPGPCHSRVMSEDRVMERRAEIVSDYHVSQNSATRLNPTGPQP